MVTKSFNMCIVHLFLYFFVYINRGQEISLNHISHTLYILTFGPQESYLELAHEEHLFSLLKNM